MFRNHSEFACALDALAREDFAAADAAFTALLGSPRSPSERAFLLNKRGVSRVALEQREPARQDFLDALEAVSDFAPALTNLGNLLLESGEIEAAIAHYRRAIAGDPDYAAAFRNLGVAYKRAGRIADSVRALRQSHRLEERARANASIFSKPARRR